MDTRDNRSHFIKMCKILGLKDLYFFLVYILRRKDLRHDWLFDRINEVQQEPDGFLDLWAREHAKTSIITFGLSLQDMMKDPEETFGFFSFTRGIAKDFVKQFKFEFEENMLLRACYPEIIWDNPRKEAPSWSLENGLILKRKGNPREATIEACGLVDSQPTGKHFGVRVYDDVVTKDSVATPEMSKKTTEAWEMSLNLGKRGGRERYIGTRYGFNDTYKVMMDRKAVKPRIYTATEDGTINGNPVLLTREELDDKYRKMGIYTFGSQMLQNPTADKSKGFKEEWLQYYDRSQLNLSGLNLYITVDPAHSKKKSSDYTSIIVVGLGEDKRYRLIDGVYDRLSLTERTKKVFELHRKYQPIGVGYERYGKDSDIEHILYEMSLQNYIFDIVELGGSVSKEERILGMVPVFEFGRYLLPFELRYLTAEDKVIDIIDMFKNEEYLPFPVGVHDDMFDNIARIQTPSLNAVFPLGQREKKGGTNATIDFEVI